jgi:hypothetical protein
MIDWIETKDAAYNNTEKEEEEESEEVEKVVPFGQSDLEESS